MLFWFKLMLLIIGAVITVLVLMQGGRSEGLTASLSGSTNLALFRTTKNRGTDQLLDRLTFGFCILLYSSIFDNILFLSFSSKSA